MRSSGTQPIRDKAVVLRRLKQLQPFPPVVAQLMRQVTADDIPFKEIAELIQSDAAVAAEVLRVANSPLLDHWGEIDSVLHAVVMLGLERLRGLVVTLSLRNFLAPALQAPILLRCWRHNLACAFLCEQLATVGYLSKDPCYTAGLLHDIGRLALLATYPAEYARVLALMDQYGLDALECERGMFAVDHCEVGSWLVEQWGFPVEFREITGRHHVQPSEERFDKMAVVRLGCRLADALGFQVAGRSASRSFGEIKTSLPGWLGDRLLPEEELSFSVAGKINALECSLLS